MLLLKFPVFAGQFTLATFSTCNAEALTAAFIVLLKLLPIFENLVKTALSPFTVIL